MTLGLFEVPTPHMETFDPSRCMVRPVNYETVRIVLADVHYIGRPGATSISLGVYADHMLGGVITFGTIPKNNAESICGPVHADGVMELTRLALYDWLPRNSESWFIARSFDWLMANRPDIAVLVSYADSSVGHAGTIYQATNWIYTGTSTNDYVFEDASGTTLHPRTTGRMRGPMPAGTWKPVAAKHRYVIFIGPRRRQLRRALRWAPLSYPKSQVVAA